MELLYTFATPPSPCGYLPEQTWSLRYDLVRTLSATEYGERMNRGWRRFGHALFRPECPTCRRCLPLRIDVNRFTPGRTMKRVAKQNAGELTLHVGRPSVTDEKLALYDRFHSFQTDFKGWPGRESETADEYTESFVDNPFENEEWCYSLGGKLVGVGYVDAVPDGLSMIYFYYDPDVREFSPGTWNVLCGIAEAQRRGLPWVYLGYFVDGCRSLEYKARFTPNEVYDWATDRWMPFRW
ncbi:MAG: arginyltransferase [Fimbriiglobus sp.]|jgi:arginine-tRNA-protein transferase|nr:arginyltransferase [Fimbriiglobus sp.]